MHPRRNAFTLLLGLFAVQLSLAEYSPLHYIDSPQDIGLRDPGGVRRREYGVVEGLLSKPNAVGSFPIAGLDISEPYDGTHSPPGRIVDGWSWEIAVRDAVPYGKNGTFGISGGSLTTVARTVLKVPDSFLNSTSAFNVSNDWALCLLQWHFDYKAELSDYPAQMFSDDGSCSSILSSQCIEALQRPTIKSDWSQSGCVCPDLRNIPDCKKDADLLDGWALCTNSLIVPTIFDTVFQNGSLWELGWTYDANPNAAQDPRSYNLVGGFARPLLLRFLPDSNHNQAGSYGLLSCPRAINATAGNVAPNGTKALPVMENPTSTAPPSTTTSKPPPNSAARINMDIWVVITALMFLFL